VESLAIENFEAFGQFFGEGLGDHLFVVFEPG